MKYLHTMVRIANLEVSLDFYRTQLGLIEIRRHNNQAGQYTNIFLAAPADVENATLDGTPLLELTYNWPDEHGNTEEYTGGCNFGHLAYEVDNIYQTTQKLIDAGVPINRPPRDGRMVFIK